MDKQTSTSLILPSLEKKFRFKRTIDSQSQILQMPTRPMNQLWWFPYLLCKLLIFLQHCRWNCNREIHRKYSLELDVDGDFQLLQYYNVYPGPVIENWLYRSWSTACLLTLWIRKTLALKQVPHGCVSLVEVKASLSREPSLHSRITDASGLHLQQNRKAYLFNGKWVVKALEKQ